VPRGEQVVLSLPEAVAKFCAANEPGSRANLFKARVGNFIGIRNKGTRLENFLIVNPTTDGDIRWLLRKMPELDTSIIEVYVVDEIYRPKNATDLPTVNPGSYGDTL
jgi:hypothetical protein